MKNINRFYFINIVLVLLLVVVVVVIFLLINNTFYFLFSFVINSRVKSVNGCYFYTYFVTSSNSNNSSSILMYADWMYKISIIGCTGQKKKMYRNKLIRNWSFDTMNNI